MATELDHDAIKENIKLILQANSSLYTTTGEANELRLIEVGHPDGANGMDRVFPFAYIHNSAPFERISKIGVKTRSSEAQGPLLHEFRYDIMIGVSGKSSRDTQEKLDDFQKLILQTLEADHRFKNGGAAVVDDSEMESVRRFSDRLNGEPVQGKTITILCRKVTV